MMKFFRKKKKDCSKLPASNRLKRNCLNNNPLTLTLEYSHFFRVQRSYALSKLVLWNNEVLDPNGTLEDTFKQGGYISEAIFIEEAGTLQKALQEVVTLDSNQVIDRIIELLPSSPDREIIVTLYGYAVESTNVAKGQARCLAKKITEFGFDKPGSMHPLDPVKPPNTTPKDMTMIEQDDMYNLGSSNSSFGEWLEGGDIPKPSAPPEDNPPAFSPGVPQSLRSEEDTMTSATETASLGPTEDSKDGELIDCSICWDTVHNREAIVTSCPMRHSACMDCAHTYLCTSSNPQIECFGEKCRHKLLPQELALMVGKGDIISGQRDPIFQGMVERMTLSVIDSDPQSYATCPSPNCKWTVARFMRGESEEATCGECGLVFCTNCSDIYHYRTTCRESRRLKVQRENWIVSGRRAYWRDDQRNSGMAEQKAREEEKRIEMAREIRLKDEEYKAAKCRHCSNCDRIVERITGCSIMRCGYDTDTKSNRQNGCGARFDWNKARRYRPDIAGRDICYEVAKPEQQKFHHVGVRCDQCKKEVQGLRFECINCKSFNLCEQCEVNHSTNHTKGHVFRLHKTQ